VSERTVDAVAAAAGLTVFAATWKLAKAASIEPAEEAVMRAVNAAPSRLYVPVSVVMQFGSLGGGVAASAVLARRHRAAGVAAAAAVLAAWGGAKLVKRATGRGRPEVHLDGMVIRGRAQTGLGFPSGHAAVSTAVVVVAWPVVSPRMRTLLSVAAAITIAARVYVAAHLPLDVAGGAAMGVATGCAVRTLAATATGRA
jgi:membrane-associated phospholipid phosphatase